MRTRFNREISPASMEIALGGQSSAFASNLMSAALALPFSGTARTLAQSQDASFASRQMPPMPSFADRGVRSIDKSTSSPSSRQGLPGVTPQHRSEEHTSELQSLMRLWYAVVCMKTKT